MEWETGPPVLSKALTPTSETLAGRASKQAGLTLVLVGLFLFFFFFYIFSYDVNKSRK